LATGLADLQVTTAYRSLVWASKQEKRIAARLDSFHMNFRWGAWLAQPQALPPLSTPYTWSGPCPPPGPWFAPRPVPPGGLANELSELSPA